MAQFTSFLRIILKPICLPISVELFAPICPPNLMAESVAGNLVEFCGISDKIPPTFRQDFCEI